MVGLRWLWASTLALVATRVSAQSCSSYGVDYANGGRYNIDGGSNQYFTFVTVFQGCNQESISPILVGPDGSEYACSAIRTQPAGQQVTSTCGIPYSVMRSGNWKIIVAGNQIAVQRTITLTVGVPQTTWVTATPTVVIGVTVTARATTVQRTLSQTQTLILVPATVTAQCNGATRTVTSYNQAPTTTVRSTVIRTATDGQVVTSIYQTTVVATATCHYPQKKRDVAATAAVAAVTSTITQTTRTVTITSQTTIAGKTTTENVLRTITQTITPAASTVCVGGNNGIVITVNVGGGNPVTQTDIVYQTSHIGGTVWVGQTQYTTTTNQASATACWRAGGWFG